MPVGPFSVHEHIEVVFSLSRGCKLSEVVSEPKTVEQRQYELQVGSAKRAYLPADL